MRRQTRRGTSSRRSPARAPARRASTPRRRTTARRSTSRTTRSAPRQQVIKVVIETSPVSASRPSELLAPVTAQKTRLAKF